MAGTAVGVDGTLIVVLENGRAFAGIASARRKEYVAEKLPDLSEEEVEEHFDHFWSEVPPVPGTRAGISSDKSRG